MYDAVIEMLLQQVTDLVKKDIRRMQTAAFNAAFPEAVVVLVVDDKDKV